MFCRKVVAGFMLFLLAQVVSAAEESTCFGDTSRGRLVGGVQLPKAGDNFVGYSDMARLAGRTYVHSEVKSIIVAAYQALAVDLPDKVYKYGETGFKDGGAI